MNFHSRLSSFKQTMSDLQILTAMLCIKDYQLAFDGLRDMYEEEVRKRVGRETIYPSDQAHRQDVQCVPSSGTPEPIEDQVLNAKTLDGDGNRCMSSVVGGVRSRLLEDELSRVRIELEAATERLWSQREESLQESTHLKRLLHVSELERTRLQGLVDHANLKRRSRPSTPQLPPEELLIARNEIEKSRTTIIELQSTLSNLENSSNLIREKYIRLKSKHRTITDKLKSGLMDHISQAKSHPPSRSVSLLQLYETLILVASYLILLVECFLYPSLGQLKRTSSYQTRRNHRRGFLRHDPLRKQTILSHPILHHLYHPSKSRIRYLFR